MAEVFGAVSYIGNKLVAITGTEGDDVIQLKCSAALCQLRLNSENLTLKASQITSYGLQIKGFAGNDLIDLDFDGSQVVLGVEVEPGEGDNLLKINFPFPFVEGSLYFAQGANQLIIPEDGTNLIVFGATNNQLSEIIINSCKMPPVQIELFEKHKDVVVVAQNGVELLAISNDLTNEELVKYEGLSLEEALNLAGSLSARLPSGFFSNHCYEE
ncbi:MAG: hypothetical protein ACHP6I_03545 [Rickettsiales bacterium]